MNHNHLLHRKQCEYIEGWGGQPRCDHPIVGGTYYCENHRRLVANIIERANDDGRPLLQRANADNVAQIDERINHIDRQIERIHRLADDLGMAMNPRINQFAQPVGVEAKQV